MKAYYFGDVFTPLGVGLVNAYGQTESTATLTFLDAEDHDLRVDTAVREKRLRSVGKPMPDVEIAIMNEGNVALADGKEGEICVRSPRVMKGYYKQEEATESAIIDGWLHTGDVGMVDEGGYLFITGRKKDLIIRGGENISPGEIEGVLTSNPKIEEAAVIGVPDNDWGEVVKAVVVFKAGESATAAELAEYCKARLASYKTPAFFARMDELPRNLLGKVLKNDLRKLVGEGRNDGIS